MYLFYLPISHHKNNIYSSWVNIGEVFQITDVEKLKNKHILVIYDVVTIRSSLESCAHNLQKIKGIKVSIVTIGSCLMLYLLI